MKVSNEKISEYINILIFFVNIILIAVGLKFQPSVEFIGLMLLLASIPLLLVRFDNVFTKNFSLAGIFAFGLFLSLGVMAYMLHIKDINTAKMLWLLVTFSLTVIPDIFATSLLLRIGASKKEAIAFFFWFLVSLGLAILFALPTGTIRKSFTWSYNYALI